MVETIGVNAGKVWNILDEKGRLSVKELKDETKLTFNNLYSSIGWLAREGKITLEVVGKEIFIDLA